MKSCMFYLTIFCLFISSGLSGYARSQIVFDELYSSGGEYGPLCIDNHYAYIAEGTHLTVYDISNPTYPFLCGRLTLPSQIVGLLKNGPYLYAEGWLVSEYVIPTTMIINVSDPRNPEISEASANWGYTLSGISGNKLYGTRSVYPSSTEVALADVSDPLHPMMVGNFSVPYRVEDLVCSGSLAYLAAGESGLYVMDITVSTSPTTIAHLDATTRVSDSAIHDNWLYVHDGESVKVIDVSVSDSPVVVGQTGFGAANLQWSDGYLYGTGGNKSVVAIDVSDPTSPTLISSCVVDGQEFNSSSPSENATLAVEMGLVCVPDSFGLHLLDFSDPYQGQEVWRYPLLAWPINVAMGSKCAVVENYTVGCFLFDITDPTQPALVGPMSGTPGGYFSGSANNMLIDGDYWYVESGIAVMIWDVSNPTTATHVTTFEVANWTPNLTKSGDLLYVSGSPYEYGSAPNLEIFDVSDPRSPNRIGTYSSPLPGSTKTAIAGSYALLVITPYQGENRLEVLNVADPTNPTLYYGISVPGLVDALYVGGYVYLACGDEGIKVFDFRNPPSFNEIHTITTSYPAKRLKAMSDLIISSDLATHFEAIDIAVPSRALSAGSCEAPAAHYDVKGDYIYYAGGRSGGIGVLRPRMDVLAASDWIRYE